MRSRIFPDRPGRRAALRAAGLFAAGLAASAFAAGCGEGDSTGGKRLTLATRITADVTREQPFTNALGWTITLSKAHLSVGPIYYFEGAAFTARRAPRRPERERGGAAPLLERLARWAIPEAHAHPGHYQAGEARGEMTEPTSVDLMQGPAALADADAVSGRFRSARFTFGAPPVGPLADELDGHVVVVEGRAEKDAEARVFRARARVDDILNAAGDPAVEGCAFEEVVIDEPGTVTLVVKPTVWLDQVDFEEVDGATADLPAGSVAQRGFTRGLKKGTAYAFSFAPGAPEEKRGR